MRHTFTRSIATARPMTAQEVTLDLDPEWTVMRRYSCGHVQHACCRGHLDAACPLCIEGPA